MLEVGLGLGLGLGVVIPPAKRRKVQEAGREALPGVFRSM